MSKSKNPRRVADNEARAKLKMIRISPQKLNLVAQMIRGAKVCLLYTSPSPRDKRQSRMPSSA